MRHRLPRSSFRLFAALVAVLLTAGVVLAPTSSAAGSASISGTVRAGNDNSPLGGATVEAYLTSNLVSPAGTATTAGDGTYTLSGLAAGTYKVSFTANNIAYQDQWYWYASSSTDAQVLTLASGDSDPFIDAYLADATTSLAGTVYDPNNHPVQGATVRVYSTGDTTHAVYSTPTAANGTYSFTGIAPGTYYLRFTADSDLFADIWYWQSADPTSAQPVTIDPGSHLTGYDDYLSDVTTSLTGSLFGPDDLTPISGGTVDLYTTGNTTTPVAETTTAADGSYSFTGMTPGDYYLHFAANPALYQPIWYWQSADPTSAQPVTISAGSHLTGYSSYLADVTTSLSGTLYGPDDVTPIAGGTVDLYTTANTTTPVAETTTAADGSYSFTGTTPGDYYLHFAANPALYQPIWYWQSADPTSAQPVTISAGSHLTGYSTYLADGTMSIGGNVLDQSIGFPVKGATVQLFGSANPVTALAATTSVGDGSFLFSGLAAGNYLVEFTDPPLFAPQWYSFATDPGSATELLVTPGIHATAYGYLTPTTEWGSAGTVSITGTAAVGSTLTAVTSGWSPSPTTYQYAWFIDGTQIPVATSASFTVTPAAARQKVTVAVTAIRAGYPTSSATSSVSIPQASYTTTGTPTISGTTRVGSTLTASPGGWAPTPDSYSYTWTATLGGTWSSIGPTAVIPYQALGGSVSVAVTAHRYGYPDVTRSSTQTSTVTAGSLTTAVPLITGIPKVGVTLSATPGSWTPVPTLTYQWKSNGSAITGATGSTFTPAAAQLGQPLTVTVTGTQTAYTTASVTSAATANVALGTLVSTVPTITGSPVVGGTLTAVPGKWRPYPVVLSYQWYVNGVAFVGATGQTFVIPGSAAGATISVAATGSETGYATTTLTSAATAAVTGGALAGPTPTITGSPQVGATLTANPGTWAPAPVALAYQWTSGGTPIPGATSSTLVVPATAVGQPITVTVTATKSGFATQTKTSAATAAVIPGVLTSPAPGISGSAVVGSTLTANTGSWGPGSVTLAYQWKAAGTNISGATSSTFTVTSAQFGQTITVTVTGSEAGYTTASVTSPATAVVAAGTLTAPIPTISGSAVVGSTLTAHAGSWGPGSVALTYQWKAGGTTISGATASTFTLTAAQLGQTITVAVTGTETGYTTATAESAATAAVAGSAFTTVGTPTITGSPTVGATLTAATGSWAPTPDSYTYVWKAGGTPIAGATGTTLTPAAGQFGQTITVTVAAHKTGYVDTAAISAPTGVVAAGALTAPTPTITGSPLVGATLTAHAGSWGPGSVTLAYQWKANGVTISGATSTTYVPSAGDFGKTITVAVTGTETGYTTATVESAPTTAIAAVAFDTVGTPTIAGAPVVGGTLSAGTGTWTPAPDSYTYLWKAGGTNVPGATGSSYVVAAGDLGKTITVTVIAHKAGYVDTAATSAASATVAAGTLTAPTPTIIGAAVVGAVLTANGGSWGPGSVALTYQWKAGGTNISGATASTLTLTATQLGQTITVSVTGTETGYTTITKESAATAAVAGSAFATVGIPTITGSVTVGATLTTGPGSWAPTPDTYSYQWKAGGTAISGATNSTYTLTAVQFGQTITVTVTAHKTGYADTPATSADTAAVAAGALAAPTPTITGTPVVGSTLTAHVGSWGPGSVALTYQWKAGGTTITGATAPTFTLTAAQLGQTITVAVTGTETGYTTATAESAATAAVAAGPTGSISGKVIDTQGNPVSNINVCLITSTGDVTIISPDAAGNYAFAGEPLGTYTMAFLNAVDTTVCAVALHTTPPYQGQYYQWASNSLDATPIVVTASQPSVVLNTVTLTATGEEYNHAKPTITGTTTVGATLTAHAGSWFPAPDSVTLQWKANGVAIAGATSSTYTLTGSEAGKTITVAETASGPTATTASATSASTAAIATGTLTAPTPTITGTAKVGSVLTAHPGTWAPAPVTLTYQWKANGTNISGATHSTYTVAASLVGKKITVTVTGSKTGYTTTAKTSTATAAVLAGTLTAPTPTITGTAKVGSVLTAHPGTWAPAPVTLTYQWKANGTNISGATHSTYTVAASLVGKKITVTVTGSKTGYTTTAKTSTATAAVLAGTLTAPTPTITGTAKVGSVLTAHPGTWTPAPVTLTYQWKANGTNISGATHSTYTVAAGLVGKKITVTVTGSKTGYTTTAKTSTATAAVLAGTLTAQVPSISGSAKVGKTLTANAGTWAPAPVTLAYQWKANGTNISGATGKTYVISSSVKGKKITVTVTGSKSGYTTVSETSLSTATVS